MDDPIVETWRINHRINLYLLDAISTEALSSMLPSSRSRTVARMFVHIHHVRVARLETSAPGLFDDLIKFDKTDKAQDKKRLRRALERSGEAMAVFIEMGLAAGKIKGFKLHPISFVGYLIAHEAYHRGEICVALTESGRRLDNDVLYGQWEWEKR